MLAGRSDSEVLVVTHKYPPSIGGMQKQSYELIKNLQSYTIVHKIIFSGKYPKALFFFSVVPWCLFKVWANPRIAVIHANDGLMALFLTPLLWLTGKKLAATVHGLDVIFKSTLYQFWLRKYLSKFTWTIAVSDQTRLECIKAGIPSARALYIPNGFEPLPSPQKNEAIYSLFRERCGEAVDNKSLIVSIGRPIKRKGFVWFIKNVLPQIQAPVLYVIVGPREKNIGLILWLSKVLPASVFTKLAHLFGFGLEALELDKLMKESDYRDKVLFTGKLPQTELDQVLLYADLFVMPNLHVDGDYEGFGLVALEAAVSGLVCLAARVDGIPSAVKDKFNGLLLPSGDADTWGITVNKLLSDKEALKDLGRLFKNNTEKKMFTWDSMAQAYFKLFQEPASDSL
ncbi:MAG: glycosyltransferase family 4 protein [Imperialibacter sp.]|uniref:glycosyltransferase family 4 protein n=1 Tax=Imperialibacter sp. TaxID=2038411 RepID=UPI0032EFE96C